MSHPPSSTDLIFNGTGVNYSWHLPRLFELSLEEFKAYRSVTLISGGSVAFLVYWALRHNLQTWTLKDFLNWNRHTQKVYGNNLLAGLRRVWNLKTGSKKPVYSVEDYARSWSMAVKPEFFQVRMKDLPANVQIPLLDRTTNEIVIASANSRFADTPVYLVSIACTAIPKLFSDVEIQSKIWGDITFARGFLPWLKEFEAKSSRFYNYNLLKSATLPNGEYIKICDHPNPKKMMQQESMKFIFGRYIASYPANIRKTNLGLPNV